MQVLTRYYVRAVVLKWNFIVSVTEAGPEFKRISGIDWITKGEIPDYVVEEENRHQVYMPQLQY